MKCALCQNDKFETVSEVDAKTRQKLRVSLCMVCGLIQQTPLPHKTDLKNYYAHNYRLDYKNTYTPKSKHIFRAAQTAMQRIAFLRASGVTRGSLVDVGAGGGELVYISQKMGFVSEGLEPNIGYSEYAQQEYGCSVVTANVEDINKTYDVITLFHVLEHLPSPAETFEKLYYALNENGVLCVEVPWIEALDASPHNIFFRAHLFYFSLPTLVACAGKYFDLEKAETTTNLRALFRAKKNPSHLDLPSASTVDHLRKRMLQKGWLEYLFKGRGLIKPITKIMQAFRERRVKSLSGRQILDAALSRYED